MKRADSDTEGCTELAQIRVRRRNYALAVTKHWLAVSQEDR